MTRRDLLRGSALGAVSAAAPMLNLGRCRLYAGTGETLSYSTLAIDIVDRSLVIDMLGLLTLDWPRLRRWHTDPSAFSEEDYKLLVSSGVNVFHPAVELPGRDAWAETTRWLQNWQNFISGHPERLQLIATASDFELSRTAGKVGILLGMQNSDHFRTAADVADFRRAGQRVSQLTYNGPNRLGSGCIERRDKGLTSFGAEVVAEMNRTGMIIDVSHAGERTTMDTFAASKQPVLITHSNCKALVPHPRCKSDGLLRAMAKSGGVMGITCVPNFLRRSEKATIHDVLDHFVHAARVAGVEHIGVGTDTDLHGRDVPNASRERNVQGLSHPKRIYDLAEGLLKRRFTPEHVELMLGRNFHRAITEILRVSAAEAVAS